MALAVLATPLSSPAGSITREVFRNIPGTDIVNLTSAANFPDNPDLTEMISDFFEAPTDVDDNYGQRMHGYIVPPVSGDYTFWIATDDGGELWLSTDEDPSNTRLIASVQGWTASRDWTREAGQRSDPIHLEADKAYYISALQKEGGGGDNLAVRWLRPDGVDQGPIPADFLLPYGTAFTPPIISSQPEDTTAVEGQLAVFRIEVENLDLVTYEWHRNDVVITGESGARLEYGPVTMADQGARFDATLTNRLGSTNSATATLTVLPDQTPPSLESALNFGTERIRITFSEPVAEPGAIDAEHYTIDPEVPVLSAAFGDDGRTIVLTTSPLDYGTSYTITVNQVADRAAVPNFIEPNSTVQFTAVEYAPLDIGTPEVEGTSTAVPGGFDVVGGGQSIGGRNDEFHFSYQERTGDFDMQVRIEGLAITDPWVQAGLMARESREPNARFAAVLASSIQLGCYFQSRTSTGGEASIDAPAGGFPVNYPETWLRLQRRGNNLTGYAGLDGKVWTQLGSVTLSGLPPTLYFGLAVASHDVDSATRVRFREVGDTVSKTTGTPEFNREPLWPSSRTTGMVISEIMYHPKDQADGKNLEFLEVYNAGSVFEDLTGWRLAGEIDFNFPDGFSLEAGAFAVIAAAPDDVEAAYGLSGVLGPYSRALANDSGTLELRNNADAIRLQVEYDSLNPWPASPDGLGHTLVLSRPSYGENSPRAWSASTRIGGSPGEMEPLRVASRNQVVINEFLAHTDDPQLDFVELFNAGSEDADLSGWGLSDDPDTVKFRLPAGTSLPAGEFLSFDQTELGFALDATGETIYLIDAEDTVVRDAFRFDGQENGVSTGRSPNGSLHWRRLASPTPGTSNAPRKAEPIILSEIMYHPISEDSNDEYVELHNHSEDSVDLSGWRFTDGIDFEIPDQTTLAPGGYLVVARNAARLIERYPQLNASNTVGDFQGRLSDSGERIVLAMRDELATTNELGELVFRQFHIPVVAFTYNEGGRWGRWADGGGSSLELVDAAADPAWPASWADSDESDKSEWRTVTFSGRLDNGNNDFPPNRLHILMQGPGECLVDEVSIAREGGANLVGNPGFERGTTGWSITGNHSTSTVDSQGADTGLRSLHVRGLGDGDTGVNSIRTALAAGLSPGNTATLNARVRWLAGWPEVLFRTRGNWIEMPARMDIPENLGSPGTANSQSTANTGPAIVEVRHSPPLPQANEIVTVTCRVDDPNGINQVNLRYRVDPSSTLSTVSMQDNGVGADARANDGVYSANLSGRSAGNLVAFRIEARDSAASPATTTFPAQAPDEECLVRWGDPIPFGTFAHYHLWSTRDTEQARNASIALDNTYRDATLVYGNFRVIYNVGFRDKGSPYHGGGGDYAVTVPPDDILLGAKDRVFASTGNGGSEATGMRGQIAAWAGQQLGIPYLHSHYIHVFRNGSRFRNIAEDLEQPNNDYAERWFPRGLKGDLYKVAIWFEFQDNNQSFSSTGATLQSFTTTGGEYKLARYRWNYQRRPNDGTANNFANIFDLVTAANDTTAGYVDAVLSRVDMDQWMRIFAYNRITGNWDAWSFNIGQNMYIYKHPGFPWGMMPWDIDFVWGLGNGPSDRLWGGHDPVINRMYDTPTFRRMLWRAYIDAVNGPLLDENYAPQIDARRSVLLNNNISGLSDPGSIGTYINQRRDYLIRQIESANVDDFAITTNQGRDFSSANPTATLTGNAPFEVAAIEINGVPYPVTWTGFTAFRLTVPLPEESNQLLLTGLDRLGNPIPGLTDSINITYTGTIQPLEDYIVINEIQYHALLPDADFVEIYNRSATTTFDLSGLEFQGLNYTFAEGALVPPNQYLVLAQDRAAFANAYGETIPVFDEYDGTLDNGGEHLALIRPADQPEQPGVLLGDVRYDDAAPWPVIADGSGPSLQLVDSTRDTYRVGNWAATTVDSPDRATPGRANSVRQNLDPFPPVWLNEAQPENVSGLEDNAGDTDPWIELFNAGTESLDLSEYFLTDDFGDLTRWAFPAGTSLGSGEFLVIWLDGEPAESDPENLHANFRLAASTGAVAITRRQGSASQPAVMDYLEYNQLRADQSFGSYPDGEPRDRRRFHFVTPGEPNNPAAPAIAVHINEFMAANTVTVTDPADQDFDDWFELYNAGDETVDLSAYTLTDDLADPGKFEIPAGTTIAPGEFLLVWADEETGQNDPIPSANLHVNFRLSLDGESIGLFALDGSPVDSVTFGPQTDDISAGLFPDGAAPPYEFMESPTPGTANLLAGSNRAPRLDPIDPPTTPEQQLLEFVVTGSDPDQDQTIRFDLSEDAPPGAAIDPVTGRFSWTPGEEDGPGEFAFAIRVTDSGTPPRSVGQRIVVNVTEVNRSPVLHSLSTQTVAEGSLLSVTITASDPDLPPNSLQFGLAGSVPEGLAIDPVTGRLTWTPQESDGPGTHAVTVTANDQGNPPLQDSLTFDIQVAEANNPPVFDLILPQTAEELSEFRYTVVANDPDSPPESVRYSLDLAPEGATIDRDTGLLTWIPAENQGPDNAIFVVRATETGPEAQTATQTFSVEVTEKNTPPHLAPLPDLEVEQGETLAFIASAEDPDLPPQSLTYHLLPGAPPTASINSETGAFVWTLDPDLPPDTYTVAIEVTDSSADAGRDTATFDVIVIPRFRVVINEIMTAPDAPGAEYIELVNNSSVSPQDLQGITLIGNQLEFTFPAGAALEPGDLLCVVQDSEAFTAAYGIGLPVAGEFSGNIQSEGDLLRLIRPGTTSESDTIVDEVWFQESTPWPAAPAGSAYQLLDPLRDNNRVGNWTATANYTGQNELIAMDATWKYYQAGLLENDLWRRPEFDDQSWAQGPALLYVEDSDLPGPKNTPLTLGQITYYFRTEFDLPVVPTGATLNLTSIVDDGMVVWLNGEYLFRLGVEAEDPAPGDLSNRTVGNASLEGPFNLPADLLQPGRNVVAVEVHQTGTTSSDIVLGISLELEGGTLAALTPGEANSVATELDAFPTLRINEVMTRFPTGLTDQAGEEEPWIELHNNGPLPVDPAGLFLSDDFANRELWTIPAGYSIPAGGFLLVIADAEADESTASELHAPFRLPQDAGSTWSLALSRTQYGLPEIVDFLNGQNPGDILSWGLLPDSRVGTAQVLSHPTPGASNSSSPTLRLDAIQLTGEGMPEFSWPADPGKTYRIEFKDALDDPAWTTLDEIQADTPRAAYTDDTATATEQRFYRIVEAP